MTLHPPGWPPAAREELLGPAHAAPRAGGHAPGGRPPPRPAGADRRPPDHPGRRHPPRRPGQRTARPPRRPAARFAGPGPAAARRPHPAEPGHRLLRPVAGRRRGGRRGGRRRSGRSSTNSRSVGLGLLTRLDALKTRTPPPAGLAERVRRFPPCCSVLRSQTLPGSRSIARAASWSWTTTPSTARSSSRRLQRQGHTVAEAVNGRAGPRAARAPSTSTWSCSTSSCRR